ncbi:MAG: hypothetical protein ACO1OG_06250 [Devosia sp.]
MLKTLSAAVLALICLMTASAAQAATYAYTLAGTLTGGGGQIPSVTNAAFTGTLSYEVTSSGPSPIGVGMDYRLSPLTLELSVLGQTVTLVWANAFLSLVDGSPNMGAGIVPNGYAPVTYEGQPYHVDTSLFFQKSLLPVDIYQPIVPSLSTFTSASFGLGVLVRTDFEDGAISYRTIGGYTAALTSFAVVPLPAGLPLLAAGVGALGLLGWRGRSRRRAAA